MKTPHERFLSQRRARVTTLSGQTLSETISSKTKHLQVSQRLTSAERTSAEQTKELSPPTAVDLRQSRLSRTGGSWKQVNFDPMFFFTWLRTSFATVAVRTVLKLSLIQREGIGSASDLFWTPDFFKYLDFRLLCQNQPQIKTVKSHQGTIKEVLAFTAPSSLLDTIPMDQIPLTFQFEGHTFMLSFLEPLYFTSPISITPYPFETQLEHFKRFNGQADSNSIRIPILTSHSTKRGPRAQDIPNSFLSAYCLNVFFCLMAAWLNEGRCPGGRSSVSANYKTIKGIWFLYLNDNCTRHL